MTSAPTDRFAAHAVPGGLKGSLADAPVPDLLQHLAATTRTGVLTLVSGGARKAIYVKQGRIVFASSNLPNDRLGEILIRHGKISVEEYEESIKALSKGKRQGKVLVEMGALSPRDLWDGVRFQVREIVHSVFAWDDGQFHFEESALPEKERITVDLETREVVLDGIRSVDAGGRIQARYAEQDQVWERVEGAPQGLEAYEVHVLDLVDGERSVAEICKESEIGDNETLKVLYALQCVGLARPRGRKVLALDQDFVQEDTIFSVLNGFNQMYGHIHRYMVKEVGPIAENVFEKYVGSLRETRKDVFGGIRLQKDGTLDPALLEKNLARLPEAERRIQLVDALNELLYALLLAVKRTLGAEHEAAIVRAFQER